ncbi:MAG: protein-glutamate O-methyltransferase CheR [Alphaproteobacteria bacterium]|nr:protein-glutamate O-methyltransferase CheR [Alphaproteobacteria bacterium]
MKTVDFDVYKNLLYEKSGLVITTDKSYLLESRLGPVLKKWNLPDMQALTDKLRGMPDRMLIEEIVDAMTTNETMFFRDQKPFDKFRDLVVPSVIAAKGPNATIRIWSAACSSGQEPYTLAIMMKENAAKWAGLKFEILATDLSKEILDQAKAGKYSQFEVQRGMPIMMLVKYFTQTGDTWTIKDEIKQMVKFQNFNLLDSMDMFGTFDCIFCRNVLIYFDQQTKGKILEKMSKRLAKHGTLFLGGAETVLGITNAFRPLEGERGVYVPADAPIPAKTA